jgi:flagellar protein FlaG
LDTLSRQLQNLNRTLQFSVDRNSGDTVIRVIDSETDKVVRQIPAEEMLALAERLRAASGVFLVDQV